MQKLLFLLSIAISFTRGQTTRGYDLRSLSVREFLRFDAGHDGAITLNEWEATLKRDDNNGDGVVSCDEYVLHSTSPKHIALKVLNQFDGGDCILTHDEAMVPYHHMDGNGDGILQEDEFVNFYIQVLKGIGLTDHGITATTSSS